MGTRRNFVKTAILGVLGYPVASATVAKAVEPAAPDTLGNVRQLQMVYVLPSQKERTYPNLVDPYIQHVHSFRHYLLRRYYCMSLRGEVPWIKHLPARDGGTTHRLPVYLEWPEPDHQKKDLILCIYCTHPESAFTSDVFTDNLLMFNGFDATGKFCPYTCSGDEGSMSPEVYKRIGAGFLRPVVIKDYLPCDDIEILDREIRYSNYHRT